MPARFDSLLPRAAADLAVLREFYANRDALFAALFAQRIKPSRLRDEIIHIALTAFGEARILHVTEFQRRCAIIGSRPAVRSEIAFLEGAGCLEVVPDPKDRRALLVYPTDKLVQFYNQVMPALAYEALRWMERTRPNEAPPEQQTKTQDGEEPEP